ncbi:MAG: GNAT family N-acetyltransferase [Alphaproteobacteria bacterium]|nr:GNAT family N-acetyltransferase [Alphaproteobacteria bacterium]
MKIQLKELQLSDADILYDFFQQLPASENGKNNHAHGLSQKEFAEWVKNQIDHSLGKNLSEGHVPSTTYILYIDDVPVGMSDLRHHLCPSLEKDGGHIGIHILPQYRGKGYGNLIVEETLKKAKKMGIESVLIFNHDDKVPAWRSSEKLGGKLDSVNVVDGIKLRKYIFDISQKSGR